MMTATAIRFYALKPDGTLSGGGGITGPVVCDDTGQEIDRLARRRLARGRVRTYAEALADVLADPAHKQLGGATEPVEERGAAEAQKGGQLPTTCCTRARAGHAGGPVDAACLDGLHQVGHDA